jgi:hypothetical protein
MSSVLYQSGLNYQGYNPVRNEIKGLHREVDELRWKLDVVMGAFDKLGGDAQEHIRAAFAAREAARTASTPSAQGSRPAGSSQNYVNYGTSIASVQSQLNQPPGGGRRF